MDVFVLILCLIALLHFVIDGILVPSWRLHLRYRLFGLRDRLRALEISDRDASPAVRNAFQRVEASTNTAISLIPKIGPRLIYELEQRLASDDALRKRIDERIAYIEKNAPPEVKALNAEVATVLWDACAANTAGWLLYVFPAILVVIFYSRVRGIIRELSALSDSETERLVPDIFAASM